MAAEVKHDGVTTVLAKQIEEGIAKINEANEILLNSETSETGDRAIDKKFKDGEVEHEDSKRLWEKAEKAREQYRKFLAEARDSYRTNVLGEEAKGETSEVDVEALKEIRKMVLEAAKLVQTYGAANKNTSVVKWAESLVIPQVGRKGSASVGGTKKPRAYVKFDGNTYDSFGEAAKALSANLSDENNKVSVTSPDLVQAWSDAGEGDKFTFNGVEVEVVLKNKDKAAA